MKCGAEEESASRGSEITAGSRRNRTAYTIAMPPFGQVQPPDCPQESGSDVAAESPSRRQKMSRRARWGVRLAVLAGCLAVLSISGCAERLFFYPTRVQTPAPEGAERVEFQSADGTRLVGWYLPPGWRRFGPAIGRGAASGAPEPGLSPAVLWCHGNAGSINDHIAFASDLPASGCGLLIFDYRGYGESGGAARQRGKLIEDAHAAWATLAARPDVDPARMTLIGQSLGAAIATNVAADLSESTEAIVKPSAVILIAPFSGWRTIGAATISPADKPGWFTRTLASLLLRGGSDPETRAAAIKSPLLILHGETDTIIPPWHGESVAAAARDAGVDTRFVLLRGVGHNDVMLHVDWPRNLADFMRENGTLPSLASSTPGPSSP